MSPIDIILLIALTALSVSGWFISLYFHLLYRQRIPERVWWMAPALQMIDCQCDEIVDTRFGRKLGKPNAFWGLWYYAALMIMMLANGFFQIPATGLLFIISLLAFAGSVYLAWGLYVLRVLCRPCIGIHVVNTFIFAVMLYREYPLLFLP